MKKNRKKIIILIFISLLLSLLLYYMAPSCITSEVIMWDFEKNAKKPLDKKRFTILLFPKQEIGDMEKESIFIRENEEYSI